MVLTQSDVKMTVRHSANLGCPSELTRLSIMNIPRLLSDVHLKEYIHILVFYLCLLIDETGFKG